MIAVITPYYKESLKELIRCHESVLNQGVPVKHYFVADGFKKQEIEDWNASHVTLPYSHEDYGNTPRGIGSLLAMAEGNDFIAYLDADNWYYPDHLQSLLSLHEATKASVCCSFRTLHDSSGVELPGIQDRDELSFRHVDTSCYLIHGRAFQTLDVWLRMPKALSIVGDRIFKSALHFDRHTFAFSKKKTLAYSTLWKAHYIAANLPVPENVKQSVGNEWRRWLLSIEGVRETVNKLGFYPL